MDWESASNVLHYVLIEQRLRPWGRWLRGRGRRYRSRWTAWLEGGRVRAVARQAARQRRHMPTIEQEALYKLTAAEISADFLQWLKAEHYQQFLADPEVQAQATARAKAELEAAYEQRREQLEDELAARRAQVQKDADAELDAALARERGKLARESEAALTDTLEERAEAQRHAAAVGAQLVDLWRQLLPEGARTYLYDAGLTVLDLTALNPVLQRAGQVAIAYQKAETSPRLVKVKIGEASWVAATRFWLEASEPAVPKSPHGEVDPARYR